MDEEALLLVGAAVALFLFLRGSSVSADESTSPGGDGEGASGGVAVAVNLTGYWPYTASSAEARMEGGTSGAARWNGQKVTQLRLITLEMHKADVEAYPYVSLSGDPTVWAYGQRLDVPALGVRDDGGPVIGRVVDTGGHFTGAGKVYRHPGYEPIDVCVDNSGSLASIGAGGPTTAYRVDGDTF